MSNNTDYNIPSPSSFEGLTSEEIKTHIAIKRYGSFTLTNAVAPSYDVQITPEEGYKMEYRDPDMIHLYAAASREKLFNLFMSLMDSLEGDLNITLVSAHESDKKGFVNEIISPSILRSYLYDFEDLLLNDGCTGISVYDLSEDSEIYWDDHKIIGIFGENLDEYRAILDRLLIFKKRMKLLCEAEHVHSTSEYYYDCFLKMANVLGCVQECKH